MSNCVIDSNSTVMAKLIAFETAITNSKFKIKGINEEKELIVVEDTTKNEGIDGKYIELEIGEVIEKPLNQLMSILNGERSDIVCHGITRIVGYYSRVNNWNKSKIQELQDRGNGIYKLGNGITSSKERQRTIDLIPR